MWKPLGQICSQSMTTSSVRPNAKPPAPGMLDNLDIPLERLLDPLDEATFAVGDVSPNEFESWEA